MALFSDGTYALPTGAIVGISSRPAKPGDAIILYGVGFGPACYNSTRIVRQKLMSHHGDDGFRWRGTDVSRIEGLSDAVFALAVTLLIVSPEVPKTFDELMVVMRGFFAFAICFALLLQVWHEQYRFFRRYNLQDSTSLVLNCTLLFLLLFYVYPLKFLFAFLVNVWMGFAGAAQIKVRQVPLLMEIFSAGFLAVSCIFMLLYGHALRRRDALELDAREVFDTKVSIGAGAI